MNPIKRWFTPKGSLTAVFYESNGCLYIDYKGCKYTAIVMVEHSGGYNSQAKATVPDTRVPVSYRNWIKAYVKRAYSVNLRA